MPTWNLSHAHFGGCFPSIRSIDSWPSSHAIPDYSLSAHMHDFHLPNTCLYPCPHACPMPGLIQPGCPPVSFPLPTHSRLTPAILTTAIPSSYSDLFLPCLLSPVYGRSLNVFLPFSDMVRWLDRGGPTTPACNRSFNCCVSHSHQTTQPRELFNKYPFSYYLKKFKNSHNNCDWVVGQSKCRVFVIFFTSIYAT